MSRTIFEYASLAVALAGCLALGWILAKARQMAPSGPLAPDVDGAPPFSDPVPDDDDDDATASWLASLHNGFMDAYRADRLVVREWIEQGCHGEMPEADSWDEDELVLRGLILSRAEMLEIDAEYDRGLYWRDLSTARRELAGAR